MERKLRTLLLGPAKLGKTSAAVCTSPRPVRVILCETDNALEEPVRQGADKYTDVDRAISLDRPYEQMTELLVRAKQDAKDGKIKTVIIDPLSEFAEHLLEQSMKLNKTQDGNDDGRRAYPHYLKRLLHCLDLSFTIPAHVIVVGHYEDDSNDLVGKKAGEGIVPLLPGKARRAVARKFNDVIYLDIEKTGDNTWRRVFVTNAKGAWGPGSRSLNTSEMIPADFNNYLKLIDEGRAKKPSNGAANGKSTTVVKPTAKLQPQVRR